MRRVVGAVMVATLFSLASIALATDSQYFKDRFSSIGWAGSDGSLQWAGPWSEVNDDGDEKKGSVRVVSSGHCAEGNCMRIAGGITLLADIGARRTADTRDMEELSLCYDLRNVTSALPLGLTELLVQVRGDGGWVTVAEYNLGSDFSGHYTHEDLDDFESNNFRVRFLVSGAAMTSEVFIDNVEVEGVLDEDLPGTTTTTTSSTTSTTIGKTTTTTAAGSTTSTSTPVATTTTAQPRATTTTTTTAGEPSSSTPVTTPTTTPGNSADDQTIAPDISLSTTTTTTTPGNSTDSGAIISADADGADGLGTSSGGSGIKAATRGVQANFQGDLFGDARTVSSLGGVDLQADYTIAAEVIRSSWAWMVLLGLLMAWAIVSRLDRNRPDLDV